MLGCFGLFEPILCGKKQERRARRAAQREARNLLQEQIADDEENEDAEILAMLNEVHASRERGDIFGTDPLYAHLDDDEISENIFGKLPGRLKRNINLAIKDVLVNGEIEPLWLANYMRLGAVLTFSSSTAMYYVFQLSRCIVEDIQKGESLNAYKQRFNVDTLLKALHFTYFGPGEQLGFFILSEESQDQVYDLLVDCLAFVMKRYSFYDDYPNAADRFMLICTNPICAPFVFPGFLIYDALIKYQSDDGADMLFFAQVFRIIESMGPFEQVV